MTLWLKSLPVIAIAALFTLPVVQAIGNAQAAGTASAEPSTDVKRLPRHFAGGSDLPNGWHITPAGKTIASMGDLITNLTVSPDGRILVSVNSGYLPHGIDVFDARTQKHLQRIELRSTFLGMAWSPDGHSLYVSGGNAKWTPDFHTQYRDNLPGSSNKDVAGAPIYEFSYDNGRLSTEPAGRFVETIDPNQVWWSGVASLSSKHWLYVANRGTGTSPSNIVVFDMRTRGIVTRISVEVSPYQTLLTQDGRYLFVSNWSSESVSVIDTSTNKVIRTLHVGMNPNDMKLSSDGRLFVACSNDNTVYVIDTRTLNVIERLSITLTPLAPEGSTPDALAVDDARKLLYIANADNNSIAVADIANAKHSIVTGFIPSGWYPSALALVDHGRALYIGNAKGEEGHPDPKGPESPIASKPGGDESVKSVQTGSLEVVPVTGLRTELPRWTRQVMEDTPYNDSLLSEARPPREPSVIPQRVGEPSPIKHIIYIIKENRTYDQVFGDLPNANGDARLTIFGEKVTPNQHALAKEYVTLDNLYCDGEVSMDGHLWSNAAYATDFNEKQWPPVYAGRSGANYNVQADVPAAGFLWDLAKRKGLTYRSYGEFATDFSTVEAAIGAGALVGHAAKDYPQWSQNARDTDRVAIFLHDLQDYEQNYGNSDPEKRLPNFVVMRMPEDHTAGASPGWHTPSAMVANSDYAIGQLVTGISQSRYWPETAIFIIEDDAQDGPDHVDARRTVGLVISPYVKRGIVDSTLYSTSSMLRSMELLLGLPPMSQYDAAAMPMYASFGAAPVVTPFNVIEPLIDVNAKNTESSYGAKQSSKMNFTNVDRAPMHALNEIIWKSVKGDDSIMPPPVHRFRPLMDASDSDDGDKNR